MNIIQITSDYIPNPLWGMGWHVRQLVDGLHKHKDLNIYVATANKSANIHNNIITTTSEVDKKLLSPNNYEIFNDFNKFNIWQEKLADSVIRKKIKLDIIHCHNWMSWICAKKLKQHYPSAKVFVTFHFLQKQYEEMKDNPIPNFHNQIVEIEEDAINNSDGVIVLSGSQEKLIKAKYKINDDSRIHLIPHSVNFEIESYNDLRKQKRDEKNINIVFLSRVEEDKGIRELIASYSNISRKFSKTKLHVIGEGPILKELRSKYESENIIFYGYLDRNNIKRILSKSQIFCLPSTSENLPLTVLEAMFFGVVPIFSFGASVPVIYEDKKQGLTFPLHMVKNKYTVFPSDISKKLTYLLKNKNILQKMSKRTYEYAVTKYSSRNMIDLIYGLYLNESMKNLPNIHAAFTSEFLIYPTEEKTIDQPFGLDNSKHPIRKDFYRIFDNKHSGVDFPVKIGTRIYSSYSGIVVRKGFHKGMGNVIGIRNGNIVFLYAHLDKYKVKLGQIVKQSEIIGLSGKSGAACPTAHLHFELRDITKPILKEMVFEPKFNQKLTNHKNTFTYMVNNTNTEKSLTSLSKLYFGTEKYWSYIRDNNLSLIKYKKYQILQNEMIIHIPKVLV